MTSEVTPQPEVVRVRCSRTQYCQALADFRQWCIRRLWLAVAVTVVIEALGLISLALIPERLWSDPAWDKALRTAVFAETLAPMFIMIAATLVTLSRIPLLECRHCRYSFSNGFCRYYAMVTGRCRKCATPVFSTDNRPSQAAFETSAVPGWQLIQAQQQAAEGEVTRAAIIPTLIWVMSGVVLLAVGGIAAPWVRATLASRLNDISTPFILPVLMFPGVIVGFWALIIWHRHVDTAVPICPHCHHQTRLALITGNCDNCGQMAVEHPFPGLEPVSQAVAAPGQGWTIAEYRRVAKPLHNWLVSGCFIGGGLAIAWMPLVRLCETDPHTPISDRGMVLLSACIYGMMLSFLGGVLGSHWFLERRLPCPDCQAELLHFYPLVISSRRCYHCGCEVLRDG